MNMRDIPKFGQETEVLFQSICTNYAPTDPEPWDTGQLDNVMALNVFVFTYF